MNTPLAIVNLKSTSRPVASIRYFSDPKKVTATYDGLDCGVAVGTPKQLSDLLLAYHHDTRARRVCRTAVISVQTPADATPAQLTDIDQRLLRASKDFQKYMRIASMLGWVHGDTATRHIHLIFCNSNTRRTLDLRPKFLKKLQGLAWTVQFSSGRGKGKRKALPMYSKSKRLDVRILAVALLDSRGRIRQERWDKLVNDGKITDFRLRTNGSVISFQFQGRRIRLSTLKNFLGLLSGESTTDNCEEIKSGKTMTNLINPNETIPAEVQGSLQDAGFTSNDVQEILKDIREAQAAITQFKPVVVATLQPGLA